MTSIDNSAITNWTEHLCFKEAVSANVMSHLCLLSVFICLQKKVSWTKLYSRSLLLSLGQMWEISVMESSTTGSALSILSDLQHGEPAAEAPAWARDQQQGEHSTQVPAFMPVKGRVLIQVQVSVKCVLWFLVFALLKGALLWRVIRNLFFVLTLI